MFSRLHFRSMCLCFRPLRQVSVAGLACLGLGTVAVAAQPSVEYALGLVPFQKEVDCDRPTAEEAKNATIKMEKEGGLNAWVVRGPRGEVLRSFADTNGDRVVDRWSYYKDGVEVYRDIDSNHNAKADQARWLNSAGTRWGIDEDENGTIDTWKMLSAEEATAQVVAAIATRDPAVFTRLLPTREELEAAGFEDPLLTELVGRIAASAKGFPALAKGSAVGAAGAADVRASSSMQLESHLKAGAGVRAAGAAGVGASSSLLPM